MNRGRIVLTGAAGFIGYHVGERLLAEGWEVFGFDSIDAYYDVRLKRARLARLALHPNFHFQEDNVADGKAVQRLFDHATPSHVVHLAAQAGVRYSIENPQAYIQSNLVGFGHILEACRQREIKHLVYASSSSVYGSNTDMPFNEAHPVDHPLSLYAATKRSNELMAHSYSHLYGLPTTGLRFFTVYGPWGRPDMAMFLFAKAIHDRVPLKLFNHGEMRRDFTYVDDLASAVVALVSRPATVDAHFSTQAPRSDTSHAPFRVFNIGNRQPVELRYVVELIEKAIGHRALIENLPMQPGDVPATFADTSSLQEWVGFANTTAIETGIARFIDWFKEYSASVSD